MGGATDIETEALELRERIRGELDYAEAYTDEALRDFVLRRVAHAGRERRWTADERMRVADRVLASFRGLDVLEPLLADAEVTEIMVNGHEEIFYEKFGRLHRYPYRFESKERLEDIIQSIVSKVNRTVNEANPIVDARLPDGSRVNAVLPGYIDVADGGRHLSLAYREGARSAAPLGRPGTPEDVARGVLMLASPMAEYINGAAVVIDGGASAGPIGLQVVDP